MVRRRLLPMEPVASQALLAEVRSLSRPLRNAGDLDPLIERVKNARVVCLGEASHGTSEYYTWRMKITRRLCEEHGFSFVAVEGDWPDCYEVNRFVKHRPTRSGRELKGDGSSDVKELLGVFRRWPTWMWGNEEVTELAGWMRQFNSNRAEAQRIGFYGLDVYSLWDSLYELMSYLRKHDPDALPQARRALRCFEPFGEDAEQYARATAMISHSCEDEVVELLRRLRVPAGHNGAAKQANGAHGSGDADDRLVAEQNALVAKNAEAYYRAMLQSDGDSWNIRDRHMAETLDRLLAQHGDDAKAVVWGHNSHIGDARFTDMADEGLVNLGQLIRERYGRDQVALIGFGSYRGAVLASEAWGARWERMTVPSGRSGSWEDVLHTALQNDSLLLFSGGSPELKAWRGHRAIGVVYRPEQERWGNYVPTILPERYDAFLYLDDTTAVHPLPAPAMTEEEATVEEVPETFPSGV